jgi:hypothetical protein
MEPEVALRVHYHTPEQESFYNSSQHVVSFVFWSFGPRGGGILFRLNFGINLLVHTTLLHKKTKIDIFTGVRSSNLAG